MKILFAGDFYPGGRLKRLEKSDPDQILGEFLAILQNADQAIVNLETPLCSSDAPITKSGPNLRAEPWAASFLRKAGFGLVTLANNHIFDHGTTGLSETLRTLDAVKLPYVGVGTSLAKAACPFFLEVTGTSLSILNFAENEWSTTFGVGSGAAPVDPVKNYRSITEACKRSDFVIVVCHGGHEMYRLPSPRMKELFRFYVDAGAKAVINHHTHCVSGWEVYKDAPIFYSLGNFLFDNPNLRDGPWTEGIAVELELANDGFDFKIHHFDQCKENTCFTLCDSEETKRRNKNLAKLNSIIANDEALGGEFENFVKLKTRQYRRYLEPSTIRVIEAAQIRGLLPSLLTRKQRTLLLNLIRCESHREIIIKMLENDVGNPR